MPRPRTRRGPAHQPGGPFVSEIREEIRSLCSLHFQDASWPTCAPCASSRVTLSTFWACSASTKNTSPSRHCPGRDRHHHHWPVAAHHPVRDTGAGHRQRGLLPQHAETCPIFWRAASGWMSRSTSCAQQGLGDLKIADYGTRRRFSRPGTTRCCACWWRVWARRKAPARMFRCGTGQLAGTSNVAVRHASGPHTPGHHGA
jgi:nicotinate phosphoribosyltransferase